MSLATPNPNMPVIYVSGDWTSDAVVMADIANQWGLDFGTAHTFTVDLWEGPSDPDDYASLSVAAGTPTLTAFDSVPAVGTLVYVLDIFWS
jgi:hypothetical protein